MCSLSFNADPQCWEPYPLFEGFWREKLPYFKEKFFLITFYRYKFKFSSRDMYFIVFLWRKLVIQQLQFHFQEGCTRIDSHNDVWFHFQLLKIVSHHINLCILGIGHPSSLISLLYNLFIFCECHFHFHLVFLHLLFMHLLLLVILVK